MKFDAESLVVLILAIAIACVIIVPLFTKEELSEEGTKAYVQIVIAVVAIISYYLGKKSKEL